MPFFPEGYRSSLEKENTDPLLASAEVLKSPAANLGATPKLLSSIASSTASSVTRSSVFDHTGDITTSSPPTSHTSSSGRYAMSTDISPLRPSRVANATRNDANVVPNSEPTSPVKGGRETLSDSETEELNDALSQPPSPKQSTSLRRIQETPKTPIAYVAIPTSRTSSESTRRKRAPDTISNEEKGVMDDAALAAALAREDAMSVRRSARSSRSAVTYTPRFDAEGRPLQSRPDAQASSSTKTTTSSSKPKKTRKSKSFSDDDREDGDKTDDDVAFQSTTKAAKTQPKSKKQIEHDDDETADVVAKVRTSRRGKMLSADDEVEHDERQPHANEKANLESPIPTETLKKSSRKKEQSQKKSKTKAASKSDLAAAAVREAEVQENSDDEGKHAESVEITSPSQPKSQVAAPEQSDALSDEAEREEEDPTKESRARLDQTSFSDPPTTVNIKRISDHGGAGSLSSSARSSPIPSGVHSPGPSSFFGKPLTSLLNSRAARRPGLTRKTNIPSLLNHRGAPKPRVVQLASSKRKMQDDDYEYDAAYEAIIAKNAKNSDDSDVDDDAAASHFATGADADEGEILVDTEYD